jgi:hypothetical protein
MKVIAFSEITAGMSFNGVYNEYKNGKVLQTGSSLWGRYVDVEYDLYDGEKQKMTLHANGLCNYIFDGSIGEYVDSDVNMKETIAAGRKRLGLDYITPPKAE